MTGRNKFPPSWDEARVKRLIEHYDRQSNDEAVAEDEAAFSVPGETVMSVPTELVAEIQKLIDRHKERG